MVASWVRKTFSGVGVTQYPPGPHLPTVQQHFLGHVLLCIDVSGSMSGAPLRAAVDGGLEFLTEARQARYECGLVLWDHGVVAHLPTRADDADVRARLRAATTGGGTALTPTLRTVIEELGPLRGDRVVCVFSDGSIADPGPSEQLAAEARALGIRFVVRGLGPGASLGLAAVLTPGAESAEQTVTDIGDLRRGIASMATDLRACPPR